MKQPSSETVVQRLRAVQELVQATCAATGFKAMLRRFAEALGQEPFAQPGATPRVSFARLTLPKSPALTVDLDVGTDAGEASDCVPLPVAPIPAGSSNPEAVRPSRRFVLKRRSIRASALEAHPDALLERLAMLLPQSGATMSALREGCTTLSIDGVEHCLAVVDDPQSRAGCLVVWDAPKVRPGELDRAFLEMLLRGVQNEASWYRKLDKTQAQLYRDDLTGLYNQRYLEIALDGELRRAQRFGTQFCLLFIDLDGFKPINDQHGHVSGSSVLKQVADVIRDAVREVDVALRYGGDEFVVVLLGATSAKGLLAAERVRRRIETKAFELEDGTGTTHITASIGLAAYPEHGLDRDTLLKRADETMYTSKRAGKNRVSIVGGTPGLASMANSTPARRTT